MEFSDPKLHPVDREFCEEHPDQLFREGFQEAAGQRTAERHEAFRDPGIIDRLIEAIREAGGVDRRFQLHIDGDQLRFAAFLFRDATAAVTLQTFDDDARCHGGIVVDGLSGCQARWGGPLPGRVSVKRETSNVPPRRPNEKSLGGLPSRTPRDGTHE